MDTFALCNANIVDCTGRDPIPGGTLVVSGGRIRDVGPADRVAVPRDARMVDVGGRTVMPGLMDAHAHMAILEAKISEYEDKHPGAVFAYSVARNIKNTLMQGYTTIRDTGGCDWSFKESVSRGLIPGPRMFVSNGPISQTGGHGDHRLRHDRRREHHEHPLMCGSSIADGADQVRLAARDQLRMGADQIKIMAGGGAASPTDAVEDPQYTVEELSAAVYEARAVRKYVCAHVYVPQGIINCVQAGVRSVEHGNFMDEESASLMKENDVFLVPTLAIFEMSSRYGRQNGAPESMLEKINAVRDVGSLSLEIAKSVGLKIGSGSDVFGPYVEGRALSLELQAEVLGAMESLICATRNNAELMGIADEVGTLEAGKLADVIVVDGDPLQDISILQDQQNVKVVLQSGRVVKGEL